MIYRNVRDLILDYSDDERYFAWVQMRDYAYGDNKSKVIIFGPYFTHFIKDFGNKKIVTLSELLGSSNNFSKTILKRLQSAKEGTVVKIISRLHSTADFGLKRLNNSDIKDFRDELTKIENIEDEIKSLRKKLEKNDDFIKFEEIEKERKKLMESVSKWEKNVMGARVR